MRIRLLLPVLTSTMLFGFSIGGTQAGSFFGPSCYAQEYAYQYPNRAHNVFGCGPGSHCTARHPFFRHRLFRRNQGVPNQDMAVNGMPMNGVPMNAMPMNGMPMQGLQANGMAMEFMPAQVAQSPMQSVPVQMTSGAAARLQAIPALQSRTTQIPTPLPLGPAGIEPPKMDSSGKPPF